MARHGLQQPISFGKSGVGAKPGKEACKLPQQGIVGEGQEKIFDAQNIVICFDLIC